jgi:uncharacterized protein (DUF4415 family)
VTAEGKGSLVEILILTSLVVSIHVARRGATKCHDYRPLGKLLQSTPTGEGRHHLHGRAQHHGLVSIHASDTDNPAWTSEDMAKARPANGVLTQLFSPERAHSLLKPRCRPKADVTKVRMGIRLSADVMAHFKASGDGWQTRIDAALRQFIAEHPG